VLVALAGDKPERLKSEAALAAGRIGDAGMQTLLREKADVA
jgi:hypothetical protein